MKIDQKTIEKVLRERVEEECLTDQEIADILRVGRSTITRWRNKFRIPPADTFERRFEENHGDGALNDVRKMFVNKETLEDIGKRFGFTRQYASLVHMKLYGIGYELGKQMGAIRVRSL